MSGRAVVLLAALLALPIGLVSELPLPVHFRPDVASGSVPADEIARSVAAAGATAAPLSLVLPHTERLVLREPPEGAEGATVAVFETALAPPEVLHVVTSIGEGARGALVVDVLQRRGVLDVPRVATFGGDARAIDTRWAPPETGTYVVHVRALSGSVGAFGIALDSRAPLEFPVATDADDSVRSIFGDARDGGRRVHHGIDIFAPRGTPVVAAANGIVTRVGTSVRGGLHVWQRAEDDEGRPIGSLYYAHLDTAAVLPGTRAVRGDVLGTVGNTGNARTTPPHLHFGLYRRFRGPEDPLPLVGRARVAPLGTAPGHPLAPWLQVAAPALNLRAGPGTSFEVIDRLAEGALVKVLGVVGGVPDGARSAGTRLPGSRLAGRWVRVRVAAEDGPLDGFVARSLLAPATPAPLVLGASTALLLSPRADAPRLVTLEPGTALESRGTFGRFRRVVTTGGLDGWIVVARAIDAEVPLPNG